MNDSNRIAGDVNVQLAVGERDGKVRIAIEGNGESFVLAIPTSAARSFMMSIGDVCHMIEKRRRDERAQVVAPQDDFPLREADRLAGEAKRASEAGKKQVGHRLCSNCGPGLTLLCEHCRFVSEDEFRKSVGADHKCRDHYHCRDVGDCAAHRMHGHAGEKFGTCPTCGKR